LGDYNEKDLCKIFKLMVDDVKWIIDIDEDVLFAFFKKYKNNFPFFGGDINSFFYYCKRAQAKRIFGKKDTVLKNLITCDIENAMKTYMNNREKTLYDQTISDNISSMYV